jgi:hypothetical protein
VVRDFAAQELLVPIQRLDHLFHVATAKRHHVDRRHAQVGRHPHLRHGDEMALEHRIVHVTPRQHVG